MMFLDLVSELEKKHDIFDKHCYDNRQVYSLESIDDLQQAQQPKSDVVYFTYDLSTLHNRKLPRNLIFCGESSFISEQLIPNTIQMPEKGMSIFLEDAEQLLHSNYKLQDIYIQMLNAVMRGKGVAAMLENVGNALNTSIAIIDMSGKVISNSVPFQVDEPVWQESIKNGYCPPLFIEHIKDVKSQYGEEGSNGPFLRHCIDNHLFYLSNRIILQGELYGYVFMIQGEREFDPLCYSVLPLITQITTDLILKEQKMDVVRGRVVTDFMTDLLNGIPLEQIQARINAAQIQFPKRMSLVLVKARYFSTESHVKNKLCRQFQDLFETARTVYYNKSIVSMIPVEENSLQIASESMKKIIEFCDEHESIAGISNPYSKIDYTKSCYEQAAKALRLASILDIPGNVHEYRKLAFYDIADHLHDLKRLSLCCHPALSLLRKYDRQSGSQLYETLETYTACGFNNAQTASELFLHRNTLSYRLQKISNMTGLDFEKPDVQFAMQYSFRLERFIFKLNQEQTITGLNGD